MKNLPKIGNYLITVFLIIVVGTAGFAAGRYMLPPVIKEVIVEKPPLSQVLPWTKDLPPEEQGRISVLREAAIKEGGLVMTSGAPEEMWKEMGEAFKAKYKLSELKITYHITTTAETKERFETESSRGLKTYDFVQYTGLEIIDWVGKGWVIRYLTPEYVYYDRDVLSDPPGYFISPWFKLSPAAVNQKKIDPTKIQTYDDLLKPEYKGLICYPDAVKSAGMYMIHYAWRWKLGVDYLTRLAKLEPKFESSSEKFASLLVSGETPIIFAGHTSRAYESAKAGAPYIPLFLAEGIPDWPTWFLLGSKGGNPNAAKLFMDFCMSKDGMDIFYKNGYPGTRKGYKLPWEEFGLPAREKFVVFYPDWKDAYARKGFYLEEFKRIFAR